LHVPASPQPGRMKFADHGRHSNSLRTCQAKSMLLQGIQPSLREAANFL
jgi:hypothetical protein